MAEAGLKRRTALGAATLIIGANFPDIDVVAVPLGVGLQVRRGVTHGILALIVLPFVLAGIMWLWNERVRRRGDPTQPAADFRQLLLLAALSILTHPTLDFMNTYGMRWLMPFVDKWFYADGLFIVDIWILIVLAIGVTWSRLVKTTRPARTALAALTVYIVVMLGITGVGRALVAKVRPGRPYMVAPVYLAPWVRDVLVDEGLGYSSGTYSLFGGLRMDSGLLLKQAPSTPEDKQAVALASATAEGRRYLHWARFPAFRVHRNPEGTRVYIGDARYWGSTWASVEVRLP
jgi:inner membrane protein